MKPYIENDWMAFNWFLEPEQDQKPYNSENKTCSFCKNI